MADEGHNGNATGEVEPENFRKIFVGGLTGNTTDEVMREFYQQFGELTDIIVMRDPNTKRSRGFGFVTFACKANVDAAMAARPHVIDGKTVDPKRAVPRDDKNRNESNVSTKRLYVSGVREDHTEEMFTEYFGKYGNVVKSEIILDKVTNKPRGFGFVTFDDYDPVDQCVLLRSHMINGFRCDVKKGLSKDEMNKVAQTSRDRVDRMGRSRGDARGGGPGGWGGTTRGGYGAQGGYGATAAKPTTTGYGGPPGGGYGQQSYGGYGQQGWGDQAGAGWGQQAGGGWGGQSGGWGQAAGGWTGQPSGQQQWANAQGAFGLVAAGRAPSQFIQAGEREFLCEIEEASNVNHVVVFITGVHPFPDGLGGSVYVRWPSPGGQDAGWHYLGFICNMKPSVIFKIAQLHLSEVRHTGVFSGGMSAGASGSVQIGIMVEPLSAIEGREAAEGTQTSQQSTLSEFAETLLRNLVNHAESYTTRLPRPDGQGFADYIPVSALQEWYNNFQRRFQQNPYFWRSLRNV
ncbi:hypothetical protein COOONC_02874 [Cooperia oncophora]